MKCVWSLGGRGVFNDAVRVCVFTTGAGFFFCCPACTEGQSPPPKKKHACVFFQTRVLT